MATRQRHPSRNAVEVVSARQYQSPSMRRMASFREGYAEEQLLDKFIVTADYKKQTGCDWNVGTEL